MVRRRTARPGRPPHHPDSPHDTGGMTTMMTLEISVTGRELDARAEQDLADRVMSALTGYDEAPDATMAKAREFTHVLIQQPRTWVTGGPDTDSAPRYLVRLTVPGSW